MIDYLCVFVCEICVKIFCPLKNLGSLLNTEKQEFFLYYGYKVHVRYMNWKYLLQGSLSFHLLNGVFQGTEVFNVEEVQFINFFFMVLALCGLRNLYITQCQKVLSYVFFQKYYNLALTFQLMIQFELIFVFVESQGLKVIPTVPPHPTTHT